MNVVFQKGPEKNEQNTFWDLGGVKGLDFASNPFSSGVPMYGLHDLNHKIVEYLNLMKEKVFKDRQTEFPLVVE